MAHLQAAADTRGLARAEISLGSVHWLACRYEEFAAAAERAEQHYAASGFSPEQMHRDPGGGLVLRRRAGTLTRSLRCSDLLERSPDRAAEAAVTSVLGGLRGLEGNCDDGRMLLAHARSLYEEVGNQSALLTTWSSLFTDVESIAGNHAAAEAEARSSVEALQVTGGPAYASTRAVQLADLLLDRGHTDAAEPWVRHGGEGSARIGRPRAVLVAHCPGANPRAPRRPRGGRGDGPGCRGHLLPHRRLLPPRAGSLCARRDPRPGRQAGTRPAEAAAARKLLREKGATALLELHRAPALARR